MVFSVRDRIVKGKAVNKKSFNPELGSKST
jgi:hypothetical protein